jgi:hypothetical protein
MKTNPKYSGWDVSAAEKCSECNYICTKVQQVGNNKKCPKCGAETSPTEEHPTSGRLLDGNEGMTISKCAAEVWYNTVVDDIDDKEKFWKNISLEEFLKLGMIENIKRKYLIGKPVLVGATSDDYSAVLSQILEEMKKISWEDFGHADMWCNPSEFPSKIIII